MIRLVLISSYLFVLTGCQLQPPQPALLAEANANSARQIRLIVEDALESKNIIISQSTFTQNSQLIVQRSATHFADSPRFLSELEQPHCFILLKTNGDCLIRHEQSKRQWYLQQVECVSGG